MKKKIVGIILVVLVIIWSGVIFFFSSQDGKDSIYLTDKVITEVKHAVKTITSGKLQINPTEVEARKTAHFINYAILGMLVWVCIYYAYKLRLKKNFKGKHLICVFLFTMVFCVLYAISDECHQLFIVKRTAKFTDVIIDTAGAFLSCSIFTFVGAIRKNKNSIVYK